MTASLEEPLDGDFYKFYMCVAIEWASKYDKKQMASGLMDINAQDKWVGLSSLNDWELHLLNDLGSKIRKAVVSSSSKRVIKQ